MASTISQQYKDSVAQFVQEVLRHSCTALTRVGNHQFVDLLPPCRCGQCSQQFLDIRDPKVAPTYAIIVEETDGQLIVDACLAQMAEDKRYLKQMLQERGISIVARWQKGAGKRQKFLDNAAQHISQGFCSFLRCFIGMETVLDKVEIRNDSFFHG
jgi:hypothetical protein